MKHIPRKRFGQHFLTDRGIIEDIVQAIAPEAGQHMVEIGPGLAAMTQPLVERLGHLTVIELDRDLAKQLRAHPRLTVIESDVLKVDFRALAASSGEKSTHSEDSRPPEVGSVEPLSSSVGAAGLALPDRRRSAPSGGSEPHEVGSVGAFELLENGANSSFVHQLAEESVGMDELLTSPLRLTPESSLPLPPALYGGSRANSLGLDLTVESMRAPLFDAFNSVQVPVVPMFATKLASDAVWTGISSYQRWSKKPVQQRADILRRAADALQRQLPEFSALLVEEAFKTWGDAVAEVREAIDFLRYYAGEAERIMQPVALLGATGETNELRLVARGVWVCISPWNFPLAIFTGQIAAALATGNAVLAKPAEQTPGVAWKMVRLLHDAGVPERVLQLLHGLGETVGAALVAAPGIAGVVFTGSTQVARTINRALAARDGAIVPLIAETGGINAMLVDSTALPEQVVDAVLQSAFRSAGQRCSALRLLCVHEAIADAVIVMIRGAASELVVGDPAALATDVGPVIDSEASGNLQRHLRRLNSSSNMLFTHDGRAQKAINSIANCISPAAFEVGSIGQVTDEIFGPVLQIVRWGSGALNTPEAVIAQINALGYGLTLGLQTRIDSRAQALADAAHVGNIYVNRNMIGAVVGVQPFGGEGLSGTGPKSGGPHYLVRFCVERTVTVNTTAAGGNAALLAG